LTGVTAIAAGSSHNVALKNDGSIVGWGQNNYGQTSVPPGLTGVTAIAAGGQHTVALKSDGTVIAWGRNSEGQTTVPPGLMGVTAIAAGGSHTVALKSDGTVVAWGSNYSGQTTVPPGLTGVTSLVAGDSHTAALISVPVNFFDDRAIDRSTTPVTFTIKNTGNEELTLGTMTKDGAHSGDFTVSDPVDTTVAPGATTTFTVTFTPSELGNRTATIHLPSNDSNSNPFDLILVGTGVLSKLDTWRQTHFISPANTGDAADLADPDQDGIANLLEFALGLNPNSRNILPITTTEGGEAMQFTYTRSKSAFLDDLIFQVQSSGSLTSGTWGTAGVSPETILFDDGTTQTVRVSVATSPESSFLRLSVTAP